MHQTFCALAAWATLAGLGATAGAAPATLRLATAAPDGTGWAREMKAFARAVDSATNGQLAIKWYWAGVAGDELEVGARIARGQLDGAASAGILCQKLAPSFRVTQISGIFRTRDEMNHVLGGLRETFESELAGNGFTSLGASVLGPEVVFTRTPVRTFDELRKLRVWVAPDDDVAVTLSRAFGNQLVLVPLPDAARAYDEGKIDGFFTIPAAALNFQWFTRARYLPDLRLGWLAGCLIVANRSFQKLPIAHQQAVRHAAAELVARMEAIGRVQDDQLLDHVFEKQGVHKLAVSDELRSQFLQAARAARESLGAKLAPPALVERVLVMLADYRASHP